MAMKDPPRVQAAHDLAKAMKRADRIKVARLTSAAGTRDQTRF